MSTDISTATTVKRRGWRKSADYVLPLMHTIVLVLSVLLIVFISYDTFNGENFIDNLAYMRFQFWMCMFFILDFFVEWIYAERKWRYFCTRFIFLLLSIPYLNILPYLELGPRLEHLYILRFIPLSRAALAISIVFGYFSKNAVTNLFSSYLVILLMIVYFCSLIFFQYEHGVNTDVDTYWTALWWSAMNMSTVGCYINPLTVEGRVIAVVLPIAGMIIFPLFTVYLTDYVKRHSRSNIS